MPAAQQGGSVRRPSVGYLSFSPLDVNRSLQEAFRQGLRDHGWIEGETVDVQWRSAESREQALLALATELAALPVQVFVVGTPQAATACQQASQTIPIVIAYVDPVETGLVTNLARPGGQVTGTTAMTVGLSAKRVELLKAVVPSLARPAVLSDPTVAGGPGKHRESQAAAARLNLQLISLEVSAPEDFPAAFEEAVQTGTDGLLDGADGTVAGQRMRVAEFATRMKLPLLGRSSLWTQVGALLCYGSSSIDQYRRAAGYVDRILHGAKPGDLPIEQPSVFEFIVNVTTAKALGITFPPDVAAQVTEWVP